MEWSKKAIIFRTIQSVFAAKIAPLQATLANGLSLGQKTRVQNTVTATYSNLSPVAHEIISLEAPKGGKFEERWKKWIRSLIITLMRIFLTESGHKDVERTH